MRSYADAMLQARSLTSADLLDAWDRCAGLPLSKRGVLLAAHAAGETYENVETLSLGTRDRFLMSVRERLFGTAVTARVDCPRCGEGVQSTFSSSDVVDSGQGRGVVEYEIEAAGCVVKFRLPNSADLAVVDGLRDSSAVREILLRRCIVSAPADAGAEVFDAVVKAMGEAEPEADIELALECPGCGHHWFAAFDILAFFWSELTAWARRVLREVHVLASAYGWSEGEVLSLSPLRRQMYMEMVTGE